MPDQDGEYPEEPDPDVAVGEGEGEDDDSRVGAKGWNDWVRRNFSAEARLGAGSSRRRSAATTTSSDESEPSPVARSEAIKAAVNNLDKRERRIGFVASVAEFALTAIVVVPYLTHHHKVSSSELKTMSAVHVFLIEGILLGAFLLLGTILRRRALVGFASLLVGAWLVEIRALAVLGIAYLGFGLWLVVKALKLSNKGGRGAERAAARSTQRSSAGRTKAAKSPRTSAPAPLSRSAPQPNKRYTPPRAATRPTPKKPTPARAEPRKR
jgi:hypothetical protein